MPKISVIIPVYNKEAYLAACLDSVLGQTLKDLEIICINDGSTDRSPKILREYADKNANLIVFDQENGGPSVARNKGADLATGEYIYFLDSDDMLVSEALEALYRYAQQHKLDLTLFDAEVIYDLAGGSAQVRPLDFYRRRHDYSAPRTGLEMLRDLAINKEYRCSPCLVLFRRVFLAENAITFVPGILYEDNPFMFACMLKAGRCAHVPYAFFIRRIVANSIITSKETSRNYADYAAAMSHMLSLVDGKIFDGPTSSAIRGIFSGLEHELFRIGRNLPDEELLLLNTTPCLSNRLLYSKLLYGNVSHGAVGDALAASNTPKVSIIIPIYNTAPFLFDCLDSACAQSLKDIEILCVDDGSTDLSGNILQKYAESDDRIRAIRQQNQYAGAARNRGIREARGEYLLFLDSDDFVEPNLLLDAYVQAKKGQCDVVLFDMDTYDHVTHLFSSRPWALRRDLLPKWPVFSRVDIPDQIFNIAAPGPMNKLCRRTFLLEKQLQFAQMVQSEDIAFVIPLMALAERISVTASPEPYYHYRVNRTGNLESGKSKNPLLFFDSYLLAQQKLKESAVYEAVKKSFINRFLGTCEYEFHSKHSYASYCEIQSFLSREGLGQLYAEDIPRHWLSDDSYEVYKALNRHPLSEKKFMAAQKQQHVPAAPLSFDAEHPQVTIVLPTYNVEKYLWDCLDSLKRQTMTNFEMIFVDDGSTDLSCEIIELYAAHDPRIRLLHQANQYAGVARNYGMQYAKGKYLLFLDPDDFFAPEMLEHAYQCAEENDSQICVFKAQKYNQGIRQFSPIPWIYKEERCPAKKTFSAAENADYIFCFCTTSPWNKLYRRDFVEENQLFFQDTRSANDLYFVLMAFAVSDRITLLNDCLLNYRVNVKTSLQATQARDPLAFYHALEKLYTGLVERNLLKRFKRSFDNLVIEFCVYNLKTMQSTPEVYKKVYTFLQEEGFRQLKLEQTDRDYFYSERCYKECLAIREMPFEVYAEAKKLFQPSIADARKLSAFLSLKAVNHGDPHLADGQGGIPPKRANAPGNTSGKAMNETAYWKGVHEVYASKTYRIGYAITWLPRKMRAFFRYYKAYGARATIKKVGKVLLNKR